MEIDLSQLHQRIEKQKTENLFYKQSIAVIIHFFRLQEQMSLTEMKAKWKDYNINSLLKSISMGEMPSDEAFNECDVENIDVFVQECCHVAGTIKGCLHLERIDEDCSSYLAFIINSQSNPKFVMQSLGFAALSLALDTAPSDRLLKHTFPITKNDKFNSMMMDTVAELNGIALKRYIGALDENLQPLPL